MIISVSWRDQLQNQLRNTQRKAFSSGTAKNLKSQLRKFLKFGDLLNEQCLPISIEQLCLYIQFLSTKLKSPQSIRNYVCGLKTFHLFCNVPFPDYDSLLVKLTFKGLDKTLQHIPHRAAPMSPQILSKLYKLFDMTIPVHTVVWCLFVFLFFLFSRKSQFMCTHASDPHIPRLVKRRDVCVQQGALQVSFKWTKTHQSGGDLIVIPLLPIPHSILCPVLAYFNMISKVPAPSHSPVFVIPSLAGAHPVYYRWFHLVLRKGISLIGLEPSSFSSHSFRRGGASYAFSRGVRGELIQRQGDWRSDAYKTYLDTSYSHRMSVSHIMSKSLQNVN